MMKNFTLFLFVVSLSSCQFARLSYLGNSYSPTAHVDVYVEPSAINKRYKVIGKGYIDFYTSYDILQKKAIALAKEKGADAVLFTDSYILNDGTSVSSTLQTDSVGKSSVTVKRTTIAPVVSSKLDLLFLKYQ
jgi:hypothetical protein